MLLFVMKIVRKRITEVERNYQTREFYWVLAENGS
ncbi:hypothetical protein AB3S75_037116 [Citrus x aurantiifolia]